MLQRRALICLLVLALLGAQMLGFMHRIVHPGGLAAGMPQVTARMTAQMTAQVHDHRQSMVQPRHSWAQHLFANHDGDPGCRLFDLLGAGAPSPVFGALPALAPPAILLAASAAQFIARRAALFDARGPPHLR